MDKDMDIKWNAWSCGVYSQSGTEKLTMPELVWVEQRDSTDMMDARMPMPALVSLISMPSYGY